MSAITHLISLVQSPDKFAVAMIAIVFVWMLFDRSRS
jgi:hypothetical protein